jgi:hypothetical protein
MLAAAVRLMNRRWWMGVSGVVAIAVAVPLGCAARQHRRATAVTWPPATAPLAAPATVFARPDLGVELTQPGGWVKRPSQDYVLVLQPASASGSGAPEISLDVPDLPFHIPGMIPIGSVRGGYLDDLRKQVGQMTVEDLPTPDVGGATARMVRSTWHPAADQAVRETALLIVHGDRVYILRGRADDAHEQPTRAAFDEIVRSIKWVKAGK